MKRAEGSTQVASFTLRRLLLLLEKIPPLALLGRNDKRFLCWLVQIQMYNVYGGRLPPLHCVVPFTHTGYIRNVAGLASPYGRGGRAQLGRRGPTLMISIDVIIIKTPQDPLSLGCAEPALPEGEPRVPFRYVLPLRPLFLQCRTPYRASSTAYGGPPSPKGKVLRGTVQPHGLYSLCFMAMDHRRYIAWYRSTARVVVGTWRAG